MAEKCGFVVLEPVEPEIVTREELELRPNAQLRRPDEDEDEGSEDREGEDEPDPLVLDHCEAFFLSYALGCLVVSDGGEGLDLVREILYPSKPPYLNVPISRHNIYKGEFLPFKIAGLISSIFHSYVKLFPRGH